MSLQAVGTLMEAKTSQAQRVAVSPHTLQAPGNQTHMLSCVVALCFQSMKACAFECCRVCSNSKDLKQQMARTNSVTFACVCVAQGNRVMRFCQASVWHLFR
jgi:hypothetical protein